MQDFIKVEMPIFMPQYSMTEKYGYTNKASRERLKKLLNTTSRGFCMYCYTRVYQQGRFYGHLEHSIEKKNSDLLIECVPNIGWSCSICNDKYKKIDEKKRALSQKEIVEFEDSVRCEECNCNKPCEGYQQLRMKYIFRNFCGSHILLQPGSNKGKDTNSELCVQYDVLNAKFEPSSFQGEYSDFEKNIIKDHINHFCLNAVEYRPAQLKEFIENVIETEGHISTMECNNLVVQLFKERLQRLEKKDVLKLCTKIYTYYAAKGI